MLEALRQGELTLQGQFLSGSNYTYLGTLSYHDTTLQTVYKPVRGEQPLWDFPAGSLAHREAAAYVLSAGLGWDLVPPTVYRRRGPIGSGSVQLYIEHNPNDHFFNFSPEDKQRLRPVVLFDLIANNADRKGGHILLGEDRRVWCIDHGLCFHVEEKLRTVVWDFAGEPIPVDLLADLEKMESDLVEGQALHQQMSAHLRPGEISALAARSRNLRRAGCFPTPSPGRRPYPWPPV